MERLRDALVFMENHLTEPLSVDRIAAEVNLSPYHFSRYFRRATGATVIGYLRHRRLNRAANRLRLEPVRLLDLALESGFQSQESFHRAFKKQFGMTPGAFRKADSWRPKDPPCCNGKTQERAKMSKLDEPRIETCDARRLIGLKMTIARGGQREIPGLWRRFRTAYPEVPNKIEKGVYGVCYDHGKDGRFNYLAAVEVEPKTKPGEGQTKLDLPAGRYAIFTHKVTEPNLAPGLLQSFNYIFGTWLPASDYELGEGPDFEYYDERFNAAEMSGEIDIYVPVREKSEG